MLQILLYIKKIQVALSYALSAHAVQESFVGCDVVVDESDEWRRRDVDRFILQPKDTDRVA